VAVATGSVLAYLRAPQTAAIFVLAIAAGLGFAVPWAVDASSDETGMWAVGLVFLSVGSSAGLAMLLAVTRAVTGSRRSSTSDLVVRSALTVAALLVFPPLALVPFAGAAWIFIFRWVPERRRANGPSGRSVGPLDLERSRGPEV
jgi:hypothetical protein